jgi:nucleotide-binding universal stress UspA family protein
MPPIVVGIDGSDESKAALRWAIEEGKLRGASIRVVHAWSLSYAVGAGFAVPAFSVAELQRASEELLDAVIREVGGVEGMHVEPVSVEGTPARVLVEAAQGADLLVVGSRGHGGFAGLLLGSVSQQCAHHAPCPLVIVRPAA